MDRWYTRSGECEEASVTPVNWEEYITADETYPPGKPIVKGTTACRSSSSWSSWRPVWDRDALRDSYPQLTEDRVRAVCAYAARS